MAQEINGGEPTQTLPRLTANTGQELRRLAYWAANKTRLRFCLINSEELHGRLVWWDLYSLRVELAEGRRIIIPKHSILYFGEDSADE